jgi:hypothetical protein
MEMGRVARIQKLPSSSLGMNSRPRKTDAAKAINATGTTPMEIANFGRRSENANSG